MLRNVLLAMLQLTELFKEEEELSELMVELVHIFLQTATLNSSLPKKLKTSRKLLMTRAKLD
jgi:hypothetical protein